MIAYTVIEYVNAGISKGGSDPALPPPTLFRFAQQWTHYVMFVLCGKVVGSKIVTIAN